MENNYGIAIATLLILATLVAGFALTNNGDTLSTDEVEAVVSDVVSQALANQDLNTDASEVNESELVNSIVSQIDVDYEFTSEDQVRHLFEKEFQAEFAVLEGNATADATSELQDNSWEVVEEYFEDNVENFDSILTVSIEDSEAEVVELGLDKDSDKVAEVSFELEVEYDKTEGITETYTKHVDVDALVTYEDGILNNSEVELTFA